MDNRVAGCPSPAGATPLLRFGLPSLPGVVGMVMAPGSASRKHPFYVVCRCGLGCCVCGGCRVGVGAWGHGPLVMLHVRALLVGSGGSVWVKCPCGGSGPHPGCWVLGWCWCLRRVVWLSAAVVAVHYPLPPLVLGKPTAKLAGGSQHSACWAHMPFDHHPISIPKKGGLGSGCGGCAPHCSPRMFLPIGRGRGGSLLHDKPEWPNFTCPKAITPV